MPRKFPPFSPVLFTVPLANSSPALGTTSIGVKAATVAFCNRCLAWSCQRAGSVSKAEYLGKQDMDAMDDGSEAAAAAARREVAAEEMNALIEDALVTALGGGGKRGSSRDGDP